MSRDLNKLRIGKVQVQRPWGGAVENGKLAVLLETLERELSGAEAGWACLLPPVSRAVRPNL